MTKPDKPLTPWQVETCRMELPRMIRAAFYGEDASSPEVSLAGMGRHGAAKLCCPLTEETLARIHHSASVRWQDADAVYLPDAEVERSGRVLFHVSYEFDGDDASGATFTVREKAVIAVYCSGGGPFSEKLCITGVTRCTEQEGRMIPQGESPTQARRRLAKQHAEKLGGCAGECCLEGVFEVIGEIIAGILDGA